MDKGVLLDRLGATGEDRMLLAKVWDRMQQARSRNIPAATDFLSPQQQILTRELLHLAGAAETEYVFLGGVPGGRTPAGTVSAGLDGDGNGGE